MRRSHLDTCPHCGRADCRSLNRLNARSTATLAQDTGYPLRTIRYHVTRLADAGHLARAGRCTDDHGNEFEMWHLA
jgi:hypothetical protein